MALEAKANSQNTPKGMRHINPVKSIVGFIKDSKNEFKRITWPERSRIIKTTTVVLSVILILTAFTWIIDSLFNLGLSSFIKFIK